MSIGERVCLSLSVLGFGMAAAPFVADQALAPMGNGRFAMAFVGAIMGVSFFVCIFLFRSRNRVRRELLAGRGVLARWTYTGAEWRAFAGVEMKKQAGNRRFLLWVTAAIMAAVTLGYLVRDPSSGRVVGAVLAVLWLLCWFVSRASLHAQARARAGDGPLVLIGRDGLLLGAEAHIWRGWGNSLGSCELREGPPRVLAISYRVPSGNATILRTVVVRVPVPAGREAEAVEVLRLLQA